ncbi:uncharacterized protein PV09_04038 [Verruconis gallopava]|uniref:Xylanolytic transcriptional activator regulatory domain-containing protein n=1 Tax=Verruconis gallopava TaxID=253628 RepID=A0A0D1XQF7_9PEZI|nr:uncharacterized protein PV09_04038 [Verruconis gallopava]KIW04856.1 hypothetical protein PV09_04038 [Verruconis gallopava]
MSAEHRLREPTEPNDCSSPQYSKPVELPSQEEIVESCRIFTTSYFQLGFIPKATFSEKIINHEVDEFLILCILSLSARFTPCLVARYGSESKATDWFMRQAHQLVPQKMYKPNLEVTQGFFLLSIAEWGNGEREQSSIHMGIAVRMAAMLKLHREETYQLRDGASEEEIIDAEMARRTFWMIQSQDNLHSGYNSPAPFSLDDITALLPCEELDFLFGVVPQERAALQNTVPAIANPSLTGSSKRSLFATLIQAHSLWGRVARKAAGPSRVSSTPLPSPLSPSSEYGKIVQDLAEFEKCLPPQQKWSIRNLRVWKDLGFELAYLSVVMMLRLSNIIVRRMHLEDIKSSIVDKNVEESIRNFWEGVSFKLFSNVEELYEQIESCFSTRSCNEPQAYPAILVLPVYVCGSLALNLWKWPSLCPHMAGKAAEMVSRCLNIITGLQSAWPMAKNWQQGLQQAATPLSGGFSPASNTTCQSLRGSANDMQAPALTLESNREGGFRGIIQINEPFGAIPQIDPSIHIGTIPNDIFDAEVTAFLQEAHYGLWDI